MESPVIVNGRLVTDEKGAREFLGMDGADLDWLWIEERPKIKRLRSSRYSYDSLVEYVKTQEGRAEQARPVRSESHRSRDGKAKKLVFPDFQGGRAS